MPDERRRHDLYEEVKQVLSEGSADELMSYLPPVGWADVATKRDLDLVRSEMDALRAEMRGDLAELRAEISGLRSEMGALRSDLRAEMAIGYGSLQRWTITTMITLTGVFSAIVFAVVRLGV